MNELAEKVRMLQERARSTRPADTSSEAWRHECEVRYVFEMQPNRRAKYLALVQAKRGASAAKALDAAAKAASHRGVA